MVANLFTFVLCAVYVSAGESEQNTDEDMLKRLAAVFDLGDKNKDNYWSTEEYDQWTELMNEEAITKQAKSEMRFMDTDGDNFVSFDELMKSMQDADPAAAEKATALLREQFDICDVDKDGKLSLKELRTLLSPGSNEKLRELEIKEIMDSQDKDKDGKISYEEFVDPDEDTPESRREFKALDTDNDDYISREELVIPLIQPRIVNIKQTKEAIFGENDKISKDEFLSHADIIRYSPVTDEGQLLQYPKSYTLDPPLAFDDIDDGYESEVDDSQSQDEL